MIFDIKFLASFNSNERLESQNKCLPQAKQAHSKAVSKLLLGGVVFQLSALLWVSMPREDNFYQNNDDIILRQLLEVNFSQNACLNKALRQIFNLYKYQIMSL